MNWGHKITITFILFAIIIITMVTISMRTDVNLVAPNYYEEELAYQDQIDRIQNLAKLANKPTVEKKNGLIILTFPADLGTTMTSGEILFYRPSQANLDKKYKIQLDEVYQQTFTPSIFIKGYWKVKMKWTSGGIDYYSENSLSL